MLKCAIFKPRYDLYGIKLEDGLKIMAFGAPNLHSQYGFSFIAESIEYSGEGALKKEYEKLKAKFEQEGLFAKERKRKIPLYLQKIGVITSLKGAVIADFSNNLGKFGFNVKIIDSRVEGQAAVDDLLSSIRTFRKKDIEILVIMRGGGSLESLIAFNNELLVREVANFPVPVIAAIGHHKDLPLVSFVADLEVSTPTAAANLLSQSWKEAKFSLEKYEKNIFGIYQDFLNNINDLMSKTIRDVKDYSDSVSKQYKDIENKLNISFNNFKNYLLNAKINLRNLLDKNFSAFNLVLERTKEKIKHVEELVNLNNPERQLKLGYSIARSDNKIIRTIKDMKIGDYINIQVADGKIYSRVRDLKLFNKEND